MESILNNESNNLTIFKQLNDNIDGVVSNDSGNEIIQVNNSLATGIVRQTKVGAFELLLEFDLRCHQDLEVDLCTIDNNPIHFLYCQKSQLFTKFVGSEKDYIIEQFQTSIIFDKNKNTQLLFKKDSHVKLTVISVCLPEGTKQVTSIIKNIYGLFNTKLIDGSFMYLGSYNLKLADQVSRLSEIKEEGVVRSLYTQAIVHLILAMEIQHHKDDVNSKHPISLNLTKSELITIKNLSLEIKKNVDVQYTLNTLTMKTGISATKLQEGFKHLFGRTVTDYIKNIRVEIAEKLIKTTDLSISEVVYSIGFSSRSYFSKIFREKYGCSPKAFQDNIKYRSVSV